jgi:hypothetical protein
MEIRPGGDQTFFFSETRVYASVLIRLTRTGWRRFTVPTLAPRSAKKFGESANRACTPHNPLISNKTAKQMFGKAWKFQAECLEKLVRKLGKSLARRQAEAGAAAWNLASQV